MIVHNTNALSLAPGSVLHRWRKNWFVLDRQGDLRYFENPDTPRAEEHIVVRAAVTQIKSGHDVRLEPFF